MDYVVCWSDSFDTPFPARGMYKGSVDVPNDLKEPYRLVLPRSLGMNPTTSGGPKCPTRTYLAVERFDRR